MLKSNEIYLGDCLDLMKHIDDKSIDMIICDLPYAMTGLKWDCLIPFELLWAEYKRIIKPNRAIILTASQPFTAMAVLSNLKWFKHEWIWEKEKGTNFASTNFAPYKVHESILVFSQGSPLYIPQMVRGKPWTRHYRISTSNILANKIKRLNRVNINTRYPRSIQKFKTEKGMHPTQKPVPLFSYLIKTYSNEGDLILDNCAGSGTTGVACKETNRNYILIEKDEHYFQIAKERLSKDVNLRF